MDNLIKNYVKDIQQANTLKQYDDCLNALVQGLIEVGYESDIVRIKYLLHLWKNLKLRK